MERHVFQNELLILGYKSRIPPLLLLLARGFYPYSGRA